MWKFVAEIDAADQPEGTVGDATRRRIQRQLDLEDARFSDDR
jgi:hypothetical protein